MPELDELIHQPLRLRLMTALYAERDAEPLEFTSIKRITEATDGNLGSHLTTLEKAGYITILKDYQGKKPRTRASITPVGQRAYRRHLGYLRALLEQAEGKFVGERTEEVSKKGVEKAGLAPDPTGAERPQPSGLSWEARPKRPSH